MLRRRSHDRATQERLIWQAASLLLVYPDDGLTARMSTVAALLEHVTGAAAGQLAATAAGLSGRDPMELAIEFVDTFDLKKRATMLLTYWTAGDTRNRGAQMIEFTQTYRRAGVNPPKGEAPDHLPVVLEFAARVDPEAGKRLLTQCRVPLHALRESLVALNSPYAHAVTAVCSTLPDVAADDTHRLMMAGPPAESVGLEPFQLTVPPRRAEGGG